MGGRGSSSGGGSGGLGPQRFAGYTTLSALVRARNEAPVMPPTNAPNSGFPNPDPYTANGNPELVKYQGQDDDKTARFLAKVARETDYADYDDGKYGFYDNSFQKLILRLGVANQPQVVSDAVFNQYVSQTGSEVMYRGFSSSDSADRLTDAKYFHTGTVIYGDGLYFTTSKSTAASYGIGTGKGAIRKMALSPQARVCDYNDARNAMMGASQKLQSSLSAAGHAGSRSYGGNSGVAQWALKNGYNCVRVSYGSDSYYYALTGDALIVSAKKY